MQLLSIISSSLFLLFFFSAMATGTRMLSFPYVSNDGKIYTCSNSRLIVFGNDGSLLWAAEVNTTCQLGISPVIDRNGKVYVATQKTVVAIQPPSKSMTRPSAADFFNLVLNRNRTSESVMVFSSVTGLAVSTWSSVIYINTGMQGLHAFMLDGTPLWSTHLKLNETIMAFPESAAICAKNQSSCVYISSPAIDNCDGSIYIARSDGWLYSFTSWRPFMKWRYDLDLKGNEPVGVTAGNNGFVYVAVVSRNMIYALMADTGSLFWQREVGPLGIKSCFPVVDIYGWISIGSLDGFLYVVSPDGKQLSKYLAKNAEKSVIIQTSPLLDCSGTTVFVAQLRVVGKRIDLNDGKYIVSFKKAWGVNIWMLVPSTGVILWSTWYPEYFPTSILAKDLRSYTIDTNWLIALTSVSSIYLQLVPWWPNTLCGRSCLQASLAQSDLSQKSICLSLEQRFLTSCSETTYTPGAIYYTGTKEPIVLFSTFLTLTFVAILVLIILLYCWWKKKQREHRLDTYDRIRHDRFRQAQKHIQTLRENQQSLQIQPQTIFPPDTISSSEREVEVQDQSKEVQVHSTDDEGLASSYLSINYNSLYIE